MNASSNDGSAGRLIGTTFGWSGAGVLASLLNGVLTARILVPDDRGLLAIAMAAVMIIGMVSALGTNVAFRVHFPRGDASYLTYFRLSSCLAVLNVLLVLLFCVGYGSITHGMLLSPAIILLVAWIGISIYGSAQLYDFFNASGRTDTSAFLNALGSVLVAIFLLVGAFVSPSLPMVLMAYALGYSLRLVIALILVSKEVAKMSSQRRDGEAAARYRQLLDSGVRLLGLNLGQALTYQSSQLFLGVVRGSADAGQYAVASSPASLSRVLSDSIGQVVFRRAATGEFGLREILRSAAIATGQTVVVALCLGISAPWLIPMVFGQAYEDAVPVLQVLLLGEVLLAPYLVFSRAAAGLGMVNVAGVSGGIGLVLIAILLLVLIPKYGLLGAAYACVGTYFAMSAFVSVFVILKLRH